MKKNRLMQRNSIALEYYVERVKRMKFDEFDIGATFATNKVTLTKKQIIEFADQYDPQYFHTDERPPKKAHMDLSSLLVFTP